MSYHIVCFLVAVKQKLTKETEDLKKYKTKVQNLQNQMIKVGCCFVICFHNSKIVSVCTKVLKVVLTDVFGFTKQTKLQLAVYIQEDKQYILIQLKIPC